MTPVDSSSLPAIAEEAVFTSAVLRMYIREVRFFEQLAAQSPIRVPTGYFGAVDEETSAFVQVMEDMGSMRMVDQNEGMGIDDAKQAVDELARWHARWWGKADEAVDRGAAVCLSDPVYPAILPMVFAEGWEKVNNAMDVDPVIASVGRVGRSMPPPSSASPALEHDHHGDYRADNILFDDEGNVVLLDFQLTGRIGSTPSPTS